MCGGSTAKILRTGYKIGCIQDVARLANGDTVFSNWVPNDVKDPAQWPTTAQLIEVNPAKKVVWALRQSEDRAGNGQRDTILGRAGTSEEIPLHR